MNMVTWLEIILLLSTRLAEMEMSVVSRYKVSWKSSDGVCSIEKDNKVNKI